MSDTPAGEGMADRDVNERWQLRRHMDHLVVLGDVDEQLFECDLLLIARPQHLRLLHPGDGEDRGVIELGVVEPIEQVDGSWSGGSETHTEAASRLRVPGGHEGGGLLVMHKNKADSFLSPQALHDPVDAVARQSEDRVDPPICQPFDKYFRGDLPTCLPPYRTWVGVQRCGTTPGHGTPITCPISGARNGIASFADRRHGHERHAGIWPVRRRSRR